ncbi:hypothetical protein GCM10027341_39430 [Spirosoma knui]
MDSGHSIELTVLLNACTLELSDERRLALGQLITQPNLDLNRVQALADRHRLAPFLYRTLQQIPQTPEPFLTSLRTTCQRLATDNLLKLHEYHQVARLLTEHGIDHIAYKGVHLAQTYYPDSSLRISGDIDILVATEDAINAIRLLQENQYQLNEKHTLYWEHSAQGLIDDLYEVSLFKPFFTNHFDIDLHWDILFFNRDYASFRLPDFRAEPTRQPEWEVVLLLTHHGVTNLWQHVYYVNDLYFLLANQSIDWTWLLKKLSQYGLERVFLVGLHWCQQIWDLSLPEPVRSQVNTEAIRSLARMYETNWDATQSVKGSDLVLKQFTYFVKAQTQVSKLVRIYFTSLTSRVFRASTFRVGKRMIYIPKEWGLVTILLRAARSVYRLISNR